MIILSAHSVQFSRSVVSDFLQPHESQHARTPCPSPTPGVHSDSHTWSQWCHPAISSSVVPFSSCPQSLPASESFPMSQLFAWGGQSIGVSALASFLPMNTQGWSPSEWTGWTSLQSKGLSRVFGKYLINCQLLSTILMLIKILWNQYWPVFGEETEAQWDGQLSQKPPAGQQGTRIQNQLPEPVPPALSSLWIHCVVGFSQRRPELCRVWCTRFHYCP